MKTPLQFLSASLGAIFWGVLLSIPLATALIAQPQNLLSNAGFEVSSPAYWTASGDGAEWSTAQSRTPNYSLALTGTGSASWTQEEAVLNWTGQIIGNQEITVGAFVYTDGVNTDPGSDAERFQLVFEFLDETGEDLLGEPLVLDLPQETASTGGWVELNNESLGALILPEASPSVRVTFRKGADATGTAYLDDLFIRTDGEGWPGDWFNPNVDAGDTWYYWWHDFPRGGDWPDNQPFLVSVTDEDAHTGTYSLKIEQLDPEATEAVAVSDRVPVSPDEPVLVSFWVRTEDVPEPESIGTGDYNIGLTALWYNQMESGAAGYGEVGGVDIRLNGEYNEQVIPLLVQESETGWTQYAFVVYPHDDAVGMELRLRYWGAFEGVTYWDDVHISSVGGDALVGTSIENFEPGEGQLPGTFQLHQNYPNPFNPSTTLSFTVNEPQEVTLEVYNVLGQRVRTLLNRELVSAGRHNVAFDAADLPSGTYLYVFRGERGTEARTMVLIK